MKSKEQVVGQRGVVALDGRGTSVSIIYALLMVAAATTPAFAQRDRIERARIPARASRTACSADVEFAYQEHSGGHDYLPALALPFLSTHLGE